MSQVKIEAAGEATQVRGAAVFRRLENAMLRLDRAVETVIPARYNPFTQTGAVATTAFIVAAVTGIVLLIWYRPSVHLAYDSVMAMEAAPLTGGFMRSLHRYASDICIFFIFIHALRLFFARRFVGARWLAWITGISLLGVLWFVGWTGYWLVWDQPAQLIAEGTADFLDKIPIFAEPISRSFLADEMVPSLLFFVVFFTHMTLPLVIGVGLWLHVARVRRPRVLTGKALSMWTVVALIGLAIVVPARAGAPADLGLRPEAMIIDGWFMAPLIITDRLGAGLLWTILAVGAGLVLTMPWWMRRAKTRVAQVNTKMCNGCTLCARDCPYDAIVMVPRTDGRRYKMEARIDPGKCVGCGICAGACDPGAIGLDWLPVQATRKRIDDWIDRFLEESAQHEGPMIAFLCSESAAARFPVDRQSGICEELVGYRVIAVPCAGWVEHLTVERALRRGAAGVLIVGCGGEEPHFREGDRWLDMRLSGKRRPSLRAEKVEGWRVRHLTFDRTRPADLIEAARRFRGEVSAGEPGAKNFAAKKPQTVSRRHWAGGVLVAATVCAVVALGTMIPYGAKPSDGAQLIVSIKHYGEREENCRQVSDDEQSARLRHMQQEVQCDRRRANIVVEVEVDGALLSRETYPPSGLSKDGPAVTLTHHLLEEGEREVVVRISDGSDRQWDYIARENLSLIYGQRQVIVFDSAEGFRHFGSSR